MKYRITIEKIEDVEVVEKTYERISDKGNPTDNGPVYGYVKTEVLKTQRTEVLAQETEDIDLVEVIKAINKIN